MKPNPYITISLSFLMVILQAILLITFKVLAFYDN
jgi:hypothetical protein